MNGVARWGMDSILQTADSLRRDAALGSLLPSFSGLDNSTIFWNDIPANADWDGFKLLINDVLKLNANSSTLSYRLEDTDTDIPYYARLAYSNGNEAGDFTKAATIWLNNSTFIPPRPGSS